MNFAEIHRRVETMVRHSSNSSEGLIKSIGWERIGWYCYLRVPHQGLRERVQNIQGMSSYIPCNDLPNYG